MPLLARVSMYLGIWILLSGKLDLFHLAIGMLTALLIIRLERTTLPQTESQSGSVPIFLRPLRWVLYAVWLSWQMLLAALLVARVILSPRQSLNPSILQFRFSVAGDVPGTVLANSITLTPGTLTLTGENQEFEVHALTTSTADGLLQGSMAGKVASLFGYPAQGALVAHPVCGSTLRS